MEKISRRIVIEGRVQGVMFRAACAQVAKGENVKGYAKNLPDGGVEVVLQGDAAGVEKVLSWCHHGPASARVDNVKILADPQSTYSDFSVL